jgi:glycosyltransferase involved in cell wall biosynthesis
LHSVENASKSIDACPLISIIIPSFNSMSGNKNIGKTLESIKNQTYSNIETLVVDNFSTDSTVRTCKNYPARFFSIQGKRSLARNYGIANMKGDYALFVDSDHVLAENLVEECVKKALVYGADCIKIPVFCVNTARSYVDCSEMRNLEFKSGLGTQTLLLFFSKSLIDSIKFPESVEIGEDAIFSSRALALNPAISEINSTLLHIEEGTMTNLVRRSWSYGKKFRSTRKEIGSAESTRLLMGLSAFDLSKLRKVVFNISRSPNTVFSFVPYITIKHYAFILSLILSNIVKRRVNS